MNYSPDCSYIRGIYKVGKAMRGMILSHTFAVAQVMIKLFLRGKLVNDTFRLHLLLQEVTGVEWLGKRLYSIPQARSRGHHPALQD